MPQFVMKGVMCLLLLCLAGTPSAVRAAESAGQELFEKRCAACHKLPDPTQPPAVGWEQQLNIMAPLARLRKGEKKDVLAYILSHSRDAAMDAALDEDRILFESKCSRCHSVERVLLSDLQGDDLRHVVNRMQNRSGTDWLSDTEVEKVLAYLAQVPPDSTPSVQVAENASPEQIFLTRCSACHTLERIFASMADDPDPAQFWIHTVSRMRGKAPQWMSDSEASQILDYLQLFAAREP